MGVSFMLAHDYGFARVMSSYYFDNSDQGPPGSNNGGSTDSVTINADGSCGGGWVCEHRWNPITKMVSGGGEGDDGGGGGAEGSKSTSRGGFKRDPHGQNSLCCGPKLRGYSCRHPSCRQVPAFPWFRKGGHLAPALRKLVIFSRQN